MAVTVAVNRYSGRIRLMDENFTPALTDKNSTQFQNLANNVSDAVSYEIFQSFMKNFLAIIVKLYFDILELI